MIESRSSVSGSWVATVCGAVAANFLLLVPSLFAFQSYISGDMGWAITVDALWDEGKLPTRDYSYFYGLLTPVVDRAVFITLGRSPASVAVLYFLCNVAITIGFIRVARIARLGRMARILGAVAAPIVVMPVVYPSPTHGLEPALLINAIAFQAAGKYATALALVTACLFIKPSMALVYGAILTGMIVFRPGPRKFLQLIPAGVTGLSIAGTLAAVFGTGPLLESLLPFTGMKVYGDENFGFFFGIGRAFWLVEPLSIWYYLFTPAGFWILATIVMIPGGIRAAIRGRGPLAGTIATCVALHVLFFCFMFGNHMSWFYYSYILVISLCGVLDRSGLPLRDSVLRRVDRVLRYVLIALAGSAQLGTVVFGLFVWTSAERTEKTAGLFASSANEQTWEEIRTIAKYEPVFLLTPTGAAHELMPEVDSPRTWFLIRVSSTPTEIDAVRAQIRAAKWVVIPRDFDTHLPRWPEFTEELQQGHFQLVKEYHLFLLLRRLPAN